MVEIAVCTNAIPTGDSAARLRHIDSCLKEAAYRICNSEAHGLAEAELVIRVKEIEPREPHQFLSLVTIQGIS